ncbi:MAG: FAD-binding oxidoreductase [Phycisphaerales bacterium]|nr:FAD-binding oxidoreductase [Phycisphaerales bacterium]
MTVSHWRRSFRGPATLDVGVCVIGAGVCGVSAALAAQRRGESVVILERHTLASGASSRNAGFLMRGAACHYAEAVELYGRSAARDLWRFTEANLEGLRREGCEVLASYRRVPSMLLALRASGTGLRPVWLPSAEYASANRAGLERSLTLMREDGLEADWIDANSGHRPDDAAWRSGLVACALVNPHDASVNSYELMSMLAAKLKAHATIATKVASPLVENQEVFAIEPQGQGQGRGFVVRAADFAVRARHVLVCTNAYASLLLPGFDELVKPRRGQMLALDAQGRTLTASYYCNDGSEYFRQAADGTIVVGGCRTYFAEEEVGFEDRTTASVQGALESFARAMLGYGDEALPITALWAGTMGFSPDGLPLIGPAGGGSSPWFCGGFTGHGMSMGYEAAHEAVGAMLEGREPMFSIARVRT